jgi:hypothetical protein
MRVPVLTVLPSQEPLVESALAAAESRPPSIPIEAAQIPASITLDPDMAAVPVGTGRVNEMSLGSVAPTQSDRFLVRGFIETDDPENIPETSNGAPLFADPVIAPFQTCGGSAPVGNVAAVTAKLHVAALHAQGLNGARVAVAVLDTGINLTYLRNKSGSMPRFDAANSWTAPNHPNPPGGSPVDHGTMCAFDVLLAAPKATLLDYPVLSGSAPGGTMVGRTLSVAVQAFSHLLSFWGVAFAPGGAPRYGGLVVSNSWGIFHTSWDFPRGHPGRYVDNPNHPFQGLVSLLARAGADIVFAAGNCGGQCADGRCMGRTTGTIMGVNASLDVLTLAGCDTNDQRVGYSSQGPSIAGMFQQKPDLTAYTHFLGSEAFGAGSADTGTSTSCPVAAGCVAALRTRMPSTNMPSANLFAQLRATARQVGPVPGWNPDYGHGIIDVDTAAQSLGLV